MEIKSILETRSLTKYFKAFKALDSVTFNVSEPCIMGLIGNNGAGKTTLLRIFNGQTAPSSGEAFILGRKIGDINAQANCILVDDTMTYPSHYKTRDILSEMADYFPSWDAEKALKLMEHFKLPLNKRFGQLSKGMKNIFNAIVGFSANVAVTLMDEPTIGMDATARKDFYDIVLNEFIAYPRLLLLSSHLIGEMENILSDTIVIKHGKIIFFGETSDLTSNSYCIQGNADDIEPLLKSARIFEKSEIFGKTQYKLMAEFSDRELKYMDDKNISRQQLGLNETCIYLCNDPNSSLEDIYSADEISIVRA